MNMYGNEDYGLMDLWIFNFKISLSRPHLPCKKYIWSQKQIVIFLQKQQQYATKGSKFKEIIRSILKILFLEFELSDESSYERKV